MDKTLVKAIGKILLAVLALLVAAACLKDFLLDTPDALTKRIGRPDVAFLGTQTNTYRMYYASLIPMGTMQFTKRNADADKVYGVQTQTKGGILESFLSATARLESRVDGATGLPVLYSEVTRVGDKTKSKDIEFDRENLVAHRGDRQIKITGDVHDPVSAFVALLNQPLRPGQTTHIRLLAEDAIYVLKAVKTKTLNKISQIDVDIRRYDQSSSHGAAFTFWVSTEAPSVPLLFKSWTPVGYVSVVLIKGER